MFTHKICRQKDKQCRRLIDGVEMLEVKDLSFSYGKRSIFENLSFHVESGECVVIAGPNGAGKSTALSVISGIQKAKSGSIIMDGRKSIVPQGTALFEDMSVKDNLKFFAGMSDSRLPEQLPLDVTKLLNTKVSKLSVGMKKRVSIVCSLLGDPQIILLDEPCAALDLVYREELTNLICERKKAGCSILYIGHDTSEFYRFYDKLIFFGENGHQQYTKAELSGEGNDPSEQSMRLWNSYRDLCLGHIVGEKATKSGELEE